MEVKMIVYCRKCGKEVSIDNHDMNIIQKSYTQEELFAKFDYFLCIACIKEDYSNTDVERYRDALDLNCDKK